MFFFNVWGDLTKYGTVDPVPNPKYKTKKGKKIASCSWCLVLVAKQKTKKNTTNLWDQIQGFPVPREEEQEVIVNNKER